MYFLREFQQAHALIEQSKRILILSHRAPDGDTVGANLALRRIITEQFGKTVVSACADSVPSYNHILPAAQEYVQDFDSRWPDLLISVDVGAHYLLRFHETKPEILSKKTPFINIDHHASNDNFGTLNIVDPGAASATYVVYKMLVNWGVRIDRHTATCLLHGLYFDTGSFMHSNAGPEVLEVASDLVMKGADFKKIVRGQFHTMNIRQLRLYGKILDRAHTNKKGVVVSAVTNKDFEEIASGPEDTMGAIDLLNATAGSRISCLLYEDRRGSIKGSLRTRVEDINLTKVAGLFGGGGHAKASGFSLPGDLRISPEGITITAHGANTSV